MENDNLYKPITLPGKLRERILDLVDSRFMRDFIDKKHKTFNVPNLVDLICSAPQDMDLKLELLNEVLELPMNKDAHSYLKDIIDHGTKAMHHLYCVDPAKSILVLTYYDSSQPDPHQMGIAEPCLSYEDALDRIKYNFCYDEKEKLDDISELDDYYIVIMLYDLIDGRYSEQIKYYCMPNGKVCYIRYETDIMLQEQTGKKPEQDSDFDDRIFMGTEGLEYWETPCKAGDILYVDMRPWYKPIYCIIDWVSEKMPQDCCSLRCLYPTTGGYIAEAALKHGRCLPHVEVSPYSTERPFFCPVYRAELYDGELPEEYAFMKPLSAMLKADPTLSQRIDDFIFKDHNNAVKDLEVVYRPTIVKSLENFPDDVDEDVVWHPDCPSREWWEDGGSISNAIDKDTFMKTFNIKAD